MTHVFIRRDVAGDESAVENGQNSNKNADTEAVEQQNKRSWIFKRLSKCV
jgi:hypothetical protein